jgi:hypothetical protein
MAITRLRHRLRADAAPCPGAIFDHHWLAKQA